MSRFSPETKKKLTAIVDLGKTVFHIGFIPTVLYLGISLPNTLQYYTIYTINYYSFDFEIWLDF